MTPLLEPPLEPRPPLAPLAIILMPEKYNSEAKHKKRYKWKLETYQIL
jgi:hypothetical protein